MDKLLQEVYQYIDQHQNDSIEDLRKLLRQPSIASEKRGIEDCAKMILGFMKKELGAEAELIPTKGKGSPVIYGSIKNEKAKRTIVVYQMYDTQPEGDPAQWVSPPFEARIIHGKIIDRGAFNSKGPLMAELEAMKALIAVMGNIPLNLIFVLDGEEEIGSRQLKYFLKENPDKFKGAEAVWIHGVFSKKCKQTRISLGNKGCIDFQLTVDRKRSDIHSSCAPIVDNPAWRLVWALSSMKDQNGRVLIEGFYDKVKPPSKDDIQLLKKLVTAGEEKRLKKIWNITKFREGLHGMELFKEFLFQPTLTINGYTSGYVGQAAVTINPSWAKANLDIRLAPDQNAEEIWMKVKQHFYKHGFDDVKVTNTGWMASASKSSRYTNIVKAHINAIKKMGFKNPLIYPLFPGTFPSIYFTSPPLNLASAIAESSDLPDHHAHVPNEYLTIEEYLTTQKMAATFLIEYSRLGGEK